MSEYKPSFKAWLFSIFLAAGFGNALANGISYLISEGVKEPGKLDFIDSGCWDRRDKGTLKTSPTCEYIFKNIGDEAVIVTDLRIGDIHRRSFETNSPGGIGRGKSVFKTANISETRPDEILVIHSTVPEAHWPQQACLYFKNTEIICSEPQT